MSVQADNTTMDGNVPRMKTRCTEDLVFVTRIFLFVKEELFSVYYLMYLSSNRIRHLHFHLAHAIEELRRLRLHAETEVLLG